MPSSQVLSDDVSIFIVKNSSIVLKSISGGIEDIVGEYKSQPFTSSALVTIKKSNYIIKYHIGNTYVNCIDVDKGIVNTLDVGEGIKVSR